MADETFGSGREDYESGAAKPEVDSAFPNHRRMKRLDPLGIAAVAAATISLLWIVPELPIAHLDDPSHWGVLGYALTLVTVLALRLRGARGTRTERRVLAIFLAGMPLVYVADWLRFGGSGAWLGIELVGTAVFVPLAWWGAKRWPWVLAAGIAAHGLWDLLHYQRTSFVPDWYTIGCAVIDFAGGLYAAAQVELWRSRELLSPVRREG